jgi:primosomal protein N' (replication factor Y) (superfamily II helicase)
VIGARSSIFLPFEKLGLIVVDEEHESSYKQQDPQPRYHARDIALYLSSIIHCRVLLGSATPSSESYYNAMNQKLGFVELNTKYSGIQEPSIEYIDLKKGGINFKKSEALGPTLINAIKETINEGKQVVLFQNRRGYAPIIQCDTCGFSPQCNNCDISLTYHKYYNQLECHYCGYHSIVPVQCPVCLGHSFSFQHFGTEKIEEELMEKIPGIKTARMDLDTTRRKKSIEELLLDFSNHSIQVLIGTQMVAKGLDFDDLQLIGVINANSIINYPDFRANERGLQLLTQVCGRAGRRAHRGKMLIQTTNTEHLVLNYLKNNQYQEYIKHELKDREAFHYPPYIRLINIRFKHSQKELASQAASQCFQLLKNYKEIQLVGPTAPLIARIRNQYIKHLLVKVPRNIDLSGIKARIQEHCQVIKQHPKLKQLVIQFDVDPYF